MKLYRYFAFVIGLSVLCFTACREHEPEVEVLPREAVTFTYLIQGDYPLDYYVDSDIRFISTSQLQGLALWDFGDGETAEGNEVVHAYTKAGTYMVTLTIESNGTRKSKKQPLMIADIKPLVTLLPFENGLCEVLTTKVNFSLELPNPKGHEEKYHWIYPEGTCDAEGNIVTESFDTVPKDLTFSNVGSQILRLQVELGGRMLEEVSINVQVGYNKEVPTLYYAVKDGNIMALKLATDAPAEMKIMPFDLGVSSGQHPFNLLFADSLLYVLDCGKQFYYVDDADGVLGDGKISVVAKDGSKVETLISNVGQAAFDDPFYGYIDGPILYYSNRNTGIIAVDRKDRNKLYNRTENPYYVQHSTLEYYGNGWTYGAIGGCFGKVEGIWYWCKFFNAAGIYRFADSDILKAPIALGTKAPEAGVALSGMAPKAYAYDSQRKDFYFTLMDADANGFYHCASIEELNAIGSVKANLAKYKVLHETGATLEANISGKPAAYEGTTSEPVGICQLALDEASGCVYFGFRRAPDDATSAPSGLMRYNPATGKVETVIEGVEIYGLVVNNTPSKMF